MDTATSAGPSRRTFLSAAIAAASAGAATPLIGTALTSPAHAEVKPPALPPPAPRRCRTPSSAPCSPRSTQPGSRRPSRSSCRSGRDTRCPRRTTRPRDRSGAGLDLRHAAGVRRGLRRPAHGAEAVVRAARQQPHPRADRHHQRDRHPAGRQRAEPHVRRDRALRLARHRCPERHQRRPGRRRRRVRGRRRPGAGPHPVCGRPAGGDDRLRRRGRRGAGALRLGLHGEADEGSRRRRPGHDQQRHRRQQHCRRRHPLQAPGAALLGRRPDLGDGAAGGDPPGHRRRERRAVEAACPVHPRSVRQRRHGHGRPVDLPARPLPPFERPRLVHLAGLPGRAAHRGGRELRARAPGRPGRERRAVRRPDRVLRLRLHRGRGQGQPGDLLVPGERPGHAQERAHQHHRAHQRLDAGAGTRTVPRILPATRWCGGRARRTSGSARSPSATTRRSRSTSPRTTCSSGCGPSTPTAGTARRASRGRASRASGRRARLPATCGRPPRRRPTSGCASACGRRTASRRRPPPG